MPRKLYLLAALGVLINTFGSLPASKTYAQIVSGRPGGGVHVRAPFVRVDVYPRGGVSVRAPFAAVYVPGRPYYYGPPPGMIERQSQPAFPTPQELAAMNDETLAQTIRFIADRLHDRLDRFDTGTKWQGYLQVSDDIFAAPTVEARRDAIGRLIGRFSSIAAEPQYQMIAGLPAFAAMQSALAELISRSGTSMPGVRLEELPPPQQPPSSGERSLLSEPTK